MQIEFVFVRRHPVLSERVEQRSFFRPSEYLLHLKGIARYGIFCGAQQSTTQTWVGIHCSPVRTRTRTCFLNRRVAQSAPNLYLFSADTNPFIPFRRIIPRLTIESFLLFSARRNNIGTPRSCILYFAILLVLKNIHPTFYRYVHSSYQLWAATPLRRTSFIKRVTLQTSRANVLRIQHQQDSPSIQISVCSSIQHERLFIKACSGPATEGTHSVDNA